MYSSTLFLDLGARRGKGSASRTGRFLPLGETRYPLYRMLDGPQGRSGRRKISPPPGYDLARSQSLYRLRYPAHSFFYKLQIITKCRNRCVFELQFLRPCFLHSRMWCMVFHFKHGVSYFILKILRICCHKWYKNVEPKNDCLQNSPIALPSSCVWHWKKWSTDFRFYHVSVFSDAFLNWFPLATHLTTCTWTDITIVDTRMISAYWNFPFLFIASFPFVKSPNVLNSLGWDI